jgi:hypothetical protein
MHVIVHQRISDPEELRALSSEPIPDRPPHWRLITSAPTRDGSACFSLWWADSAEALQRCLGRALGAAGPLECHEVDEENAMGLPGWGATMIYLQPDAGVRGEILLPRVSEPPYLP